MIMVIIIIKSSEVVMIIIIISCFGNGSESFRVPSSNALAPALDNARYIRHLTWENTRKQDNNI